MVNWLRALTTFFGGSLIVLSLWAITEYGTVRGIQPFAKPMVLGVIVFTLPLLYLRGRRWLSVGVRHVQNWRNPSESSPGNIFVSTSPVAGKDEPLETIAESLRQSNVYDEVYRTTFAESEGLTVSHTGFHKSYIRITESGKLVLTGTTKKTRQLATQLEDICSTTLEPSVTDPFTVSSITKAPRVLLMITAVVLLVVGVGGVSGAAYPPTAYNPAERTVFVGIDAYTDINPAASEREASVVKAQFLIEMLDEEAVEIRWEYNTTAQVRSHGQDALLISSHARKHIATARTRGFSDERKLSRLEANLRDAERAVADAIAAKSAALPNEGPYLDQVQTQLLEANSTTTADQLQSPSTLGQGFENSCVHPSMNKSR